MTSSDRFNLVTGRFAAGGSRMGPKHRENEDSLAIAETNTGGQRRTHGSLYVIADGVGGHTKGEVASGLAVQVVQKAYFATKGNNPSANLSSAVGEANRRVHESATLDGDELSMATTVVAAAVLDGLIVVANVGDSRAYIVGDGAIRQVSHDHSWVQDQIDNGRLTPEEARLSPRRNIITRALGLSREVEAEVKTETDTARHTRLVLCSDGVHGVLDDSELADLVEGLEPQAAVEKILGLVDERDGRDDATVVIVEIGTGVSIHEGRAQDRAGFFPAMLRLFRRQR